LVDVVIGVTVPSKWLTAYALVPSGVIAIPYGPLPTDIVEVTPVESVIAVTVPLPLPL